MRTHLRTWAPAALMLLAAVPAAAEAELAPGPSLAPPLPATAAVAGSALAIDGDFALLGAPGDAARGLGAGAVQAWRRVGGIWTFEQTIRPQGLQPGDGFGTAVAVSGGIALVGAPGDDGVGANAGVVYALVHGSNGWSALQTVTGLLVGPGDAFGAAIALDGDTAIVGARLDDQLGNSAGAAYVLRRGSTFWGEQARLVAPNGLANDQFGSSVAISGDMVVVGSPAANVDGVNSGTAYVFERTGNTWSAGVELPDVGTSWFDAFGSSLATDGERIAVGAPSDDSLATDGGGAWTFVRGDGEWLLEGALAPDLAGGEMLGASVGLAGDLLVVGAPGEDFSSSEDGTVRVAEWGGDEWVAADPTGVAGASISDALGTALAIDGDLVLVGAPLADDGQVDSGGAHLFTASSQPVGTPVCLGDGSGVPCPCDNPGGPGEGCENSTGVGARLFATGRAVVGDDTLRLGVVGALPQATGVFVQGNLELGVPFRDGILCVTHEVERLEVVQMGDTGAGASGVEISVEGHVPAGATRVYQYWYRDPAVGPCGLGSNLTGALSIDWQ